MDAITVATLRKLEAAAAAIEALPMVGAQAYIAGFRGEPIVNRHFTAGNQQRYGWAPLTKAYFDAKAHGIVHLGNGNGRFYTRAQVGDTARGALTTKTMRDVDRHLSGGRKAHKLDKNAGFRSSTGELSTEGSGSNLPMLVRSGAMREAVTSRTHRVEMQGDTAVIIFANLPEYAIFHHEGRGRLPKRSPVEPSATDMAEVHAAMTQYVDRAVGTGGTVPVSGTTVPAVARFRPS